MWRVIDQNTQTVVERCDSPKKAHYALMIFSAHELKNGRQANYRIDPPVDLGTIEELDLPSWAIEELTKAEKNP